MPSVAVEPQFLTIDDGAIFVSMSAKTLRRLIRDGRLQAHRPLGPRGPIRLERADLVAFVRGQQPDQAEQEVG
jgi:excisionase family DNA binding protein